MAGAVSMLALVLVISTSGLARAQGITLAQLAGNWAVEGNATYALCFNVNYSALVNCKGAPHVAFYIQTVIGQSTIAANGISCGTIVISNSPEFPNPATPANSSTQVLAGKTTFYNATTESGNSSFTAYNSGVGTFCSGSVLINPAKSAPLNTSTSSFVVSQKGTRIDSVTDTLVATPIPYIGDVVQHGEAFRQ